MKKTVLNLLLISAIILSHCKEKKDVSKNISEPVEVNTEKKISSLPQLESGKIEINDNAFGEVIALTGKPIQLSQFTKINQLIVKDDFLVIKNGRQDSIFMVYNLPSLELVLSFGRQGAGPDEMKFPNIIETSDPDKICYIYEQTNENLYALNKNLELKRMGNKLPNAQRKFGDKQLYILSNQDKYYVESNGSTKSVYYLNRDSTNADMIYDLALDKKNFNSWAAYIGDFGANEKYNRWVFAYKYFKTLVFCDYQTNITKILEFDEKPPKVGSATDLLAPSTTTYYWGISPRTEKVYHAYSGRTPIDVSKQNKKEEGYIFIESFNWNGVPLYKYKLDKWGYFTVDEKRNVIYLAPYYTEIPLFVYSLEE